MGTLANAIRPFSTCSLSTDRQAARCLRPWGAEGAGQKPLSSQSRQPLPRRGRGRGGDGSCRGCRGGGAVPVLNQTVRDGPTQEVAFEQRLETGEGADCASAQGKRVLSRADSRSRGPGDPGGARRWAVHTRRGLCKVLVTTTQGGRLRRCYACVTDRRLELGGAACPTSPGRCGCRGRSSATIRPPATPPLEPRCKNLSFVHSLAFTFF